MKYALAFPNGDPWADARTLADLAGLPEDSGWDGVFLEDYLVWQGHPDVANYDRWIALAAMAMRTQQIRLGTTVTPLVRRHPWQVARETMTLDHLSNGRLFLGVGLGDTGESVSPDRSLTHLGPALTPRERAAMLDEALNIIVGLWSGEPFSWMATRLWWAAARGARIGRRNELIFARWRRRAPRGGMSMCHRIAATCGPCGL